MLLGFVQTTPIAFHFLFSATVSNVTVMTVNASALSVSWGALENSYLSHYTIYYSAFSLRLGKVVKKFKKKVPPTSTFDTVNIRELRAGVEHEFHVTASLEIDGKVYEGEKSKPEKMKLGKA